ncbi:MAG TPA: hypothetical protein GXX15_11430 [Clostridia bacterium]|nr:hypothetical protein [Clostridia bacterium]
MKKGDFLWGSLLLLWIVILIIPTSREAFIAFTSTYPYLGGFIKFGILATMGDLLGVRILKDKWIVPKGLILKAIVWGVIGMVITLMFTVFTTGVAAAQSQGILPFKDSKLARAFFGSAIMNVTFGPMIYIYEKFGDMLVNTRYENNGSKLTVKNFVDGIDWYTIVSFSWLKIQTLVWIPCHTIVFLLPEEYRVLAAAFLSILLGVIIAISRKRNMGVQIEAED